MSINCACLKNNGQGSSSDIPWGWRKKKKPQQKPDIILPVWRISLVCSHVSGWYKLRRVGGRVGTGENKAECVIYDVWLQNRNVWRTSAHLQKPTQEVRGFLLHVAHGSLRFMWRPDVCPPVWIYTQSGDLRGSPTKEKKKLTNIHMDKPYFMAKINICPHSSLCHLIGLLYSQRVVFVFLRLKYDY